LNGRLNASINCVDRWAKSKPDATAIIWEGDTPDQIRRITYRELMQEVCRTANILKTLGVKKGEPVAIYMPMVPEAAYAMLACARLGAPHSVVFAGFSAVSLADRCLDSNCKVIITANEGIRGGKVIPLKKTVDAACDLAPCVKKVLVYQRTPTEVNMVSGRDVWWHEAALNERPFCPAVPMDSEDFLFLLYTSGSTGKPKGMAHSTAGYLVWAMLTVKYVFDLRPDDIFACVADVGWITGHSYIVYGPLANGATTFMFESLPTYPNPSRYWDMVQRHRITQLYTAPTAIRALMQFGDQPLEGYDRSSLRVLGSVGEPINPEAWRWYYHMVGGSKAAVVDTYWQTETGGHMLTPLPGATPMKPGSATFPFFGVEPVLLDPQSGAVLEGNDVRGMLCIRTPWPGIARTVFNDHQRYLSTYMNPYPGFYFTGDGAHRDQDGYLWITGRVDDVLNVSGHRLGTAEIESALVEHHDCSEAAVVGFPHDIKGEGIFAYIILRQGAENNAQLMTELQGKVREYIGPIAKPDIMIVAPGLPKTRSGKIMRRILRKLAAAEYDQLGDISTLADPSVVEALVTLVKAQKEGQK
jgi:acetyl-CoA synthetase